MSVRGAESMLHATRNQKKKRKNSFKIRTRWGSRARLKALLTIAACRDLAQRVRSMCTQLSLISATGHSLHQPISLLFSPLFISHLFSFSIFLRPFLCFSSCFFWFHRFTCSSKSKCSWQKVHLFLFSSLCFYFSFSFRFPREGDLMAEDRTRHQNKWEKRQWWERSPGSEKVFSWRFFWAWPKVWVDGAESTEENALADNFLARLGSSSVFPVIDWLICDADSPRVIQQWMLIISLCSFFMFNLSSTRGNKLPVRLGNPRKRNWT